MMTPASRTVPAASSQDSSWLEALTELRRELADRRVRFVELWWTDLAGEPGRMAIGAEHLIDEVFERGMVFEGPSLAGHWEGLVRLRPDPASFLLDPLAPQATAALFCDMLDARAEAPHPDGARPLLRVAELRLLQAAGADAASLGCENEFFALEGGKPASDPTMWELLRLLASMLDRAGVPADAFRRGPWPGQGRVQMRSGAPLAGADRAVFYREQALALARRLGVELTFLPKPLPGPSFSNMPIHAALFDGNRNLFHDADGWGQTSGLARWFSGGLLRHAGALLAFCCPTTNSYRRFAPGLGAPIEPLLTLERNTAVCRIPARSPAPGGRRVRFGCADGSANPYLAFAALLQAGTDGIARNIEPELDEGQSPSTRLPVSLEEALRCLDADRGFLKEGGVFADGLIDAWLANRRAHAARLNADLG